MTIPYGHGGNICEYKQNIIDFSSNINPLGLSRTVRSAYERALDACTHYPDPFCRELIEKIALHEGVASTQIVCGNGAADLIYRIVACFRPKRALVTAPTFSEYENALKLFDCKISKHYLQEQNAFKPDLTLLEEIDGADMIFLCNPANPVGNIISRKLMAKLAGKAEKNKNLLIVDECFLDFLPEEAQLTAKPFLEGGHVIILKAFTKIYAMPGLRLGYCILPNEEMADSIAAVGQPWPVSAPAQACGIAALEDEEYLAKTRAYIAKERRKMEIFLEKLGFKLYSSRANFIFAKHSCKKLKELLLDYNILIRDCSNYSALENGYYRFAVRAEHENDYLLECLGKILI